MSDILESEFHCFFTASPNARQQKKKNLSRFIRFFRDCRSIADLGCGDGVFLELLAESYPQKRIAGVESNPQLMGLCRKINPRLLFAEKDMLAFVSEEGAHYDGFVMCDVIEHLDFKTALEIMKEIPQGALLFIRTPNVNSILGHQFYLQTPAHIMPYSPFLIKNMLERTGFRVLEQGESDGIVYPKSLPGIIRKKILQLLFINEYSRIFGGGNYFVVARK